MLVTIAALADRDYAEVQRVALHIVGKPWTTFFARKWSSKPAMSFRNATRAIATYYGGEALAKCVDSNDNSGTIIGRTLPAVGRGVVRFYNKRSRSTGHIAPWCDGMIQDTDGSAPCSLADYLRKHSMWARLDYIRSIAPEGNPEDNPNPTSPDMGY